MATSPRFNIGFFRVAESHIDGEYHIKVSDTRTGATSTFGELSLLEYDELLSGLESDPSIHCLANLTDQFQAVANG